MTDFFLRTLESDDLPMITAWMNDPAVDRFWDLAGSTERTAAHLALLAASDHSTPYIGVLDGVPMSYWEIYRADLDPVARHYDAQAHDGGIHLLLGPAEFRGRGLGADLIRRVLRTMFDADPAMTRIIAEPDVGNVASIRSFERAGFEQTDEIDLPDKRAALMVVPRPAIEHVDLVGIGIGPFNLSLAALADRVPDLTVRFFDDKPRWDWHPGLLFDDARLQVPFLADLVTLVDPTSPWSFLSYLHQHDRLFPFYFSERFHAPRREYDRYCRWVAKNLPSCGFGDRVTHVSWEDGNFAVTTTAQTVRARNIVLGIGTEPVIPESLRGRPNVIPASEYLFRKAELSGARDITVIGSGQTGAEVFLDLLRERPQSRDDGVIRWLTRSPAFAPMEYSKLGLEHFTPDYTRYFHGLSQGTKDRRVPEQWQLYKAISVDTIGDIFDLLYERTVDGRESGAVLMPNVEVVAADSDNGHGTVLQCKQLEQEQDFTVTTDIVIVATGFTPREPELLNDLAVFDDQGRLVVDENFRVKLRPDITGNLYVQNAEGHTHGVGAPDLGLGAHRAAVILNDVANRPVYRLPNRTAFTTFGLEKTDVRTD